MTAPVLDTKVSPTDATFQANAAHNRALAEQLRADVARAALGGNEKSRERHTARGKLLPRERVERLLDGARGAARQTVRANHHQLERCCEPARFACPRARDSEGAVHQGAIHPARRVVEKAHPDRFSVAHWV